MEKVTHVGIPLRGLVAGVGLPEEVQALLCAKADEYGVTPQLIADEACKGLTSDIGVEEAIEKYARSL